MPAYTVDTPDGPRKVNAVRFAWADGVLVFYDHNGEKCAAFNQWNGVSIDV